MSDRDPSVRRRINVLIAEGRTDILGSVLEKAVVNHADMTLLDHVRISRAGAVLRQQHDRCVLLLLSHGRSALATANRFLMRHPDLVVIAIDLASPSIAIRLRQIGLDQLLETICTLGRPDARNPGALHDHHA
jgi:hypothetical protein